MISNLAYTMIGNQEGVRSHPLKRNFSFLERKTGKGKPPKGIGHPGKIITGEA